MLGPPSKRPRIAADPKKHKVALDPSSNRQTLHLFDLPDELLTGILNLNPNIVEKWQQRRVSKRFKALVLNSKSWSHLKEMEFSIEGQDALAGTTIRIKDHKDDSQHLSITKGQACFIALAPCLTHLTDLHFTLGGKYIRLDFQLINMLMDLTLRSLRFHLFGFDLSSFDYFPLLIERNHASLQRLSLIYPEGAIIVDTQSSTLLDRFNWDSFRSLTNFNLIISKGKINKHVLTQIIELKPLTNFTILANQTFNYSDILRNIKPKLLKSLFLRVVDPVKDFDPSSFPDPETISQLEKITLQISKTGITEMRDLGLWIYNLCSIARQLRDVSIITTSSGFYRFHPNLYISIVSGIYRFLVESKRNEMKFSFKMAIHNYNEDLVLEWFKTTSKVLSNLANYSSISAAFVTRPESDIKYCQFKFKRNDKTIKLLFDTCDWNNLLKEI